MTKTAIRPPRRRSPLAAGYCRLCGLTRWHWRGCDEIDRDRDGKEIA